jgi:hypothetical protein
MAVERLEPPLVPRALVPVARDFLVHGRLGRQDGGIRAHALAAGILRSWGAAPRHADRAERAALGGQRDRPGTDAVRSEGVGVRGLPGAHRLQSRALERGAERVGPLRAGAPVLAERLLSVGQEHGGVAVRLAREEARAVDHRLVEALPLDHPGDEVEVRLVRLRRFTGGAHGRYGPERARSRAS